jgi:Mrp family chromosome partitioning ATPase
MDVGTALLLNGSPTMSRIADVLRKAQGESNIRSGEVLPEVARIEVPWSLEDVPPDHGRGSVAPARNVLTDDEPQGPTQFPPGLTSFRTVRPVPPGRSAVDVEDPVAASGAAGQVDVPVRASQPPAKVDGPARGRRAAVKIDEEIASLVARLFFTNGESAVNVRHVLFASVDAGGDSAEITSRVAETLAARTDGSVCLVDLDLQKPVIHERYKIDLGAGLSTAMMDSGPMRGFAYRVPGAANLWVMPAGLRIGEGSSLAGARARRRLIELLGTFDYVIARGAPVGRPEEATPASSFDGIVLVLDATTTQPRAARAAAESLKAGNARLLGTVLSNPTA